MTTNSAARTIDVVILSRHDGELHPEVERGLSDQRDVQLVVHRVRGTRTADDRSRCDSIARGRNEGKRCGTAPWLMFLDDDVVLGPECIATLVAELVRSPSYAAFGADYLGERRFGQTARHVSLGATLFRREALDQIQFVWRGASCECQCCCDDLRKLKWRIDYSMSARAHHLPKRALGYAAEDGDCDGERITCLCLTSGRAEMLQRAVQCYRDQTYRNRELVVVYRPDDQATRLYLEGLEEPSILPVAVPSFSELSLGALRNLALQLGTGKYVATWDDDDWSGLTRLEEQMRMIRASGLPGCVLTRLTLYDFPMSRAYLSGARAWENTILVERSAMPAYPNIAKGEDTPVVGRLARDGQLAHLDAPDLYIYTYHGKNTWGREHWDRILRYSRPLGDDASEQISSLLDETNQSALQCPEAISVQFRKRIVEALDPRRAPMSGVVGTNSYALTAGALQRARRETISMAGN